MIGRLLKIIVLCLSVSMLLVSCHTREVAYLSDAQRDSVQEILDIYNATILPGDQLYIYVASKTPESVIPFNQETNSKNSIGSDYSNVGVPSRVAGYTVAENGTILFPILGTIEVVNLTQDSLCHYLERRLRDEGYIIDPQVTTKLLNFRVTVVGEVKSPQQIHANGTRLTIFEALAICGDITENGMRTNVTVVRQDGFKREIGEIDLTKKEMLSSPYYYLHNNDIVYVEPSDLKKVRSDRDPNVPNYISITTNAISIIRTNISRIVRERRRNR